MARETKKVNQGQRKERLVYLSIVVIALALTYGRWLFSKGLSWGDWYDWSKTALLEWQYFNIWWDQDGLGRSFLNLGSSLWAPFFSAGSLLVRFFNLDFLTVSKILWFGPFILISLIAMPFFWRTFFPADHHGRFVATLFYSFNTYILLLTMGGHISGGLVYALSPILVATTYLTITERRLLWPVLSACLWIVSSYYEARFTILIILFTIVFSLFFLKKDQIVRTVLTALWLSLAVFLAHAWWIILFRIQNNSVAIPGYYLNIDRSYLSLVDTLSLYHAQWPDNILGKMNNVPLLFGLFPLLIIYTLFLSWRYRFHHRAVIFFSLIYLVSAFLSKGTNVPAGPVYQLLFDWLPFFKPFRDSSKFLLLTMFAASVILGLGYACWQKVYGQKRFAVATILVVLFFISLYIPAFLNSFGGTFVSQLQPQKYVELGERQDQETTFYRTAWSPKFSRFSHFSANHPRFGLVDTTYHEWADLVSEPGDALSFFQDPVSHFLLDSASVRYLALPYDSQNDIYLNFKSKREYSQAYDQVNWLKKISSDKIFLYENDSWYPKISTSYTLDSLSDPTLIDNVLARRQGLETPAVIFQVQEQTKQDKPKSNISWLLPSKLNLENPKQIKATLETILPGKYRLSKSNNDLNSVEVDDKQLIPGESIELTAGEHKIKASSQDPFSQVLDLDENRTDFIPCYFSQDTSLFNQYQVTPGQPIKLLSNGQTSCLSLKLKNLEENSQYQIRLKSKMFGEGERAMKWISESGDNQSISISIEEPVSIIQFKTFKEVNFATVIFRMTAKKAEWQLEDLTLVGPIDSNISEKLIFTTGDIPNLPVSPIKTEVLVDKSHYQKAQLSDISNDFYLAYGTTFHPDWQLKINGQEIVKDHFMINGWANGWLVQGVKNQAILEIEFKPANLFQKTKWVSLGWVGLLALTLLSVLIFQRKKEK